MQCLACLAALWVDAPAPQSMRPERSTECWLRLGVLGPDPEHDAAARLLAQEISQGRTRIALHPASKVYAVQACVMRAMLMIGCALAMTVMSSGCGDEQAQPADTEAAQSVVDEATQSVMDEAAQQKAEIEDTLNAYNDQVQSATEPRFALYSWLVRRSGTHNCVVDYARDFPETILITVYSTKQWAQQLIPLNGPARDEDLVFSRYPPNPENIPQGGYRCQIFGDRTILLAE